jgi:hypothetical protein
MLLISSEQNRIAHRICKAYPSLSWKESFKLARTLLSKGIDLSDFEQSVFGQWNLPTQQGIAGHFWAIRCLYKEAGEEGKAKAFERVSHQLYAATEAGEALSFKYALNARYWGSSIIDELIEYFICASLFNGEYTDHTDRVMRLIQKTQSHDSRVRKPFWVKEIKARLYREREVVKL